MEEGTGEERKSSAISKTTEQALWCNWKEKSSGGEGLCFVGILGGREQNQGMTRKRSEMNPTFLVVKYTRCVGVIGALLVCAWPDAADRRVSA